MREFGSPYPNIFSRLDQGSEARDRNIADALAARGRDRISTPELVTSNFFSDQRGSVSPRLLAALPVAAILLLSSSLFTACPATNPTENTPTSISIPAPTATPWPAGGLNRSICDPREIVIRQDGTTPVPPPNESDIITFNECMRANTAAAEATATAEAQKPLTEFIILPPAEIQRLQEDARARGEFKIPLPDIVTQPGVAVREVRHRKGFSVLAITLTTPGDYTLVSPLAGKVIDLEIAQTGMGSIVDIAGQDDWRVGLDCPAPSTSSLKLGDDVMPGNPLVSFTYQPDGQPGQIFIKSVIPQYAANLPANIAVFMIGLHGKLNEGKPVDLGINNILTYQGKVVAASSAPKK